MRVDTSDPGDFETRAAGWLEHIRSHTPPRPHLRPRRGRCALLVIDMLRYFADPAGRCYLPWSEPAVPRIAALLAAWRSDGAPVFFTRHAHEGEHDLGMLGTFFSDYIRAGEPESEIIAPLAPLEGETVMRKTTYDAFLGTGLEEKLRTTDCDQIVIAGVLTHMCCATTARSAFCRGFEVYLPADATASSTEQFHISALLTLADSVAVLLSTDEILAAISG